MINELEIQKEIFNHYTLDTLPHSIILTGKEGAGKRTLAKYISDIFNLNILDISSILDEELINNIYRNASPRLYLIDLRTITDKEQNILLKLFEEPSANTFVILLANDTTSILPTILNRGKIYNIRNYDKDYLMFFAKEKQMDIPENYFGSIIETPGDICGIYSNNIKLNDIKDLTDKIINKLQIASYPNTLSIVNKLNFKDEYDKLDVNLFLKILRFDCLESFINGNKKAINLFEIVNKNIIKLNDSRINKQILVTHMLTELWCEVR